MRNPTLVVGLATAFAAAQISHNNKFVQGDPARFTYIPMLTPESGPCEVAEGPDGLVYVQEALANKIARYNQNTGELTEFDIPFTTGPTYGNLTLPLPSGVRGAFVSCAMRNGYDGKLYLSNGDRNQLVQFDVETEEVKVFTPTGLLEIAGNLQPFNDVTSAPDGIYFTQTTLNAIAKFDYRTEKFTYHYIPTPLAVPVGLYYAQDKAVWFVETAGNKVGRLDRTSGQIQEFSLPVSGAGPFVVRGETQDSHGVYLLWFTCAIGGAVGSINQRSKEIHIYPENALSVPVEVAQDYQDNIWTSHLLQDTLGVFNPTYGNHTQIILPNVDVPASQGLPVHVSSGIWCKPVGEPYTRGTGNAVWFTENIKNALVRYDLDGLVY